MEELLTKLGEVISLEMDEVEDITYLEKEMGYSMVLKLKDGKNVVLSII